jgi:two-component system, NtrC family, sensor kinase
VLVNLMINAIQAMPDGGTLSLRSETLPTKIRITAADTGQGMPPEVLSRVFDPFFTTKRSLGTGLGLSITRTLISRAGGTISATSEPGQGSQFVIDLPLSSTSG